MIAEAGRIGESWFRQMKTTEEVRKYAAEQGNAEEEAPGMEVKSKEFAEKCGDVHTKE